MTFDLCVMRRTAKKRIVRVVLLRNIVATNYTAKVCAAISNNCSFELDTFL